MVAPTTSIYATETVGGQLKHFLIIIIIKIMVNLLSFPRVTIFATTHITLSPPSTWYLIQVAQHTSQAATPPFLPSPTQPQASASPLQTMPLLQALQKASYHFLDRCGSHAIACPPFTNPYSPSARPLTQVQQRYSPQQKCSLPTTTTSTSN